MNENEKREGDSPLKWDRAGGNQVRGPLNIVMNRQNNISEFEKAVMNKFLSGEDATLINLREQFKGASLKHRECSGVGFFTSFSFSDGVKTLGQEVSFKLGDVYAEIDGLLHGAGFLLHVDRGRISVLEGYTYDEPWPEVINDYKIFYLVGGALLKPSLSRDMNALRNEWKGAG